MLLKANKYEVKLLINLLSLISELNVKNCYVSFNLRCSNEILLCDRD